MSPGMRPSQPRPIPDHSTAPTAAMRSPAMTMNFPTSFIQLSAALRDETWDASFDYRVQPASGLDAIDLLNGSFWNFRNVVVFTNSLGRFRRSKHSRSALDSP